MPFINGGEIADDSTALEVVDAAPAANEAALGGFYYEAGTKQLHVSYAAVDPTDTFVRGIAVSQDGRVRCLDVAAGGAGDPYFDDVKLLLHFEGADASTTFTDVTGKTMTANGNAQIDTAQFKFGAASGVFDGTGDYVSCGASADFSFGTGDFTIEFWMRSSQASGNYIGMVSVASGSTTGNWIIQNRTTFADCAFYWYYLGSWAVVSTNTNINDGNWHHIAVAREGGNVRIFQDGVLKNTTSGKAADVIGTASAGVNIGWDQYDNGFYNGWIDDLRITKGVARYTADFTVPDAPFPDSSGGGGGGMPADAVIVGGVAIKGSTGQLCTDTVGPATQYPHGWPVRDDGAVIVTTAVINDFMLMESGDKLLLESGDDIIL